VTDDTMTLYDLRVTVERIDGRSVCGLAVGDYFELTESSRLRIPEGRHFCIYALQSVLPFLAAKQRELAESDWLEKDSHVACPDPDERVIMRIERIARRTLRTDDLT
jgi:uncharacterized repeat protein (TIGR04076 family)